MGFDSQPHTEAAIYWAAVSLIVCEGLSVPHAAARLGLSSATLRHILQRRQVPKSLKLRSAHLHRSIARAPLLS